MSWPRRPRRKSDDTQADKFVPVQIDQAEAAELVERLLAGFASRVSGLRMTEAELRLKVAVRRDAGAKPKG
jgi:hypothetical protein